MPCTDDSVFVDELGVLQCAARVELRGAPCRRGDADAGAVHDSDGLERRARRHRVSRLILHVGRGEVDRVRGLRLSEGTGRYRFPTASGFTTLMGFPSAKASNWSMARA